MSISTSDLLVGIQYATAFDKRGWGRPTPIAAKHCRRTMKRIISSAGHPPLGMNVIALSAVSRALHARNQAMADLVAKHCSACTRLREGCCAGVDRSNVVSLDKQARPGFD